MNRIFGLAGLAAVGGLLCGPVDAAADATSIDVTAANAADVECLTYFSAQLGNSEDPGESATRNLVGVPYYLGRLDARSPDLALAPLVTAAAVQLDESSDAVAARCEAELDGVGDRLITLSDEIGE